MPTLMFQLLMEEKGVESTFQKVQQGMMGVGSSAQQTLNVTNSTFNKLQADANQYLNTLQKVQSLSGTFSRSMGGMATSVPAINLGGGAGLGTITPTVEGITAAISRMQAADELAFPTLISQLQNVGVNARPVESALGAMAAKARDAEATYRSLTEQIKQFEAAQASITKRINAGGMDLNAVKNLQSKRSQFGRQAAEARGKQDVVGQYDLAGQKMDLLDNSGQAKAESELLGEVVTKLRQIQDGAQRTAEALRMGGPALASLVNESGNLYNSLNKNRLAAQELTHIEPGARTFLQELEDEAKSFGAQLTELETKRKSLLDAVSTQNDQKGASTLINQLNSLENKIRDTDITYANLVNKLSTEPTTLAGLQKAATQLDTARDRFEVDARQMANSLNQVEAKINQLGQTAEKSSGPLSHFQSVFTGTFMGQIAYSAINQVLNLFTTLGTHLVQDPALFENYNTEFTRLYGTATKGIGEVNKIAALGLTTAIPIDKLEEVDRSLATYFGTNPKTYADKFHRSMDQIRQDVIDTTASRKDLQSDTVMEVLARAAEGSTGRTLNSLRQLRLGSESELRAYGVNITASGKITSDTSTLINGILSLWEQKYGGLGKAASQTFDGMKTEASNFMVYLGATLGKDVMKELKIHLLDFFEYMKKPDVQQTLIAWGEGFGKATKLAFDLFDGIGKGVAFVLGVFRPLTDLLGDFLKIYPSDPQTLAAPWTVSEQAALDAAAGYHQAADAVVDYKTQISDLEDQLTGLRQGADLQGIAFEKMLAPIKEAETAADRLFAHFNQTTEINKLKKEISRDTALARDTYSSEGRSAALRLVDEQAQLTKVIQDQAHTSQKEGFEDQINTIEKKKTKFEQDTKVTEIGLQQRIDAFKKLQKAIDDANTAAGGLQDSLDNSDPGNIPAVYGAVDDLASKINDTKQNSWELSNVWETQLKPALEDIVDLFAGPKGLNQSALGFQVVMNEAGHVVGTVWDSLEVVIIGVLRDLGNLGALLGAVAQDGTRDLHNLMMYTLNSGKFVANFQAAIVGQPQPYPNASMDTGVDHSPSRIPAIIGEFGNIGNEAASEIENRASKRDAEYIENIINMNPDWKNLPESDKVKLRAMLRKQAGMPGIVGPPEPPSPLGPGLADTRGIHSRQKGSSQTPTTKPPTTTPKSGPAGPHSTSSPLPANSTVNGAMTIAEIRLTPDTITIQTSCAECGKKENKAFIKANINYIAELLGNRAR